MPTGKVLPGAPRLPSENANCAQVVVGRRDTAMLVLSQTQRTRPGRPPKSHSFHTGHLSRAPSFLTRDLQGFHKKPATAAALTGLFRIPNSKSLSSHMNKKSEGTRTLRGTLMTSPPRLPALCIIALPGIRPEKELFNHITC